VSMAAGTDARLGSREFDALRRIIHRRCGIALGDSKRTLVESRLVRRLRARELPSFAAYVALLERGGDEDEQNEMVNCITTNKTSFYREPHHFDLLAKTIVPALIQRARDTGSRRIRVWSAGCSSGQEPYSIAIALREALGSLAGWDIRILASDIDTNVLATAKAAVYDQAEIEGVPFGPRAKSFEEEPDGDFRVVRELRELVTFRKINFVDESWPIRAAFDVIFCRNVVIYFNRDTQRVLYERISRLLAPEGYLLAGHSENLHWLGDLFSPVGGTAYRLAGHGKRPVAPRSAPPSRKRSVRPRAPSRPPRGASRPPRAPSRPPDGTLEVNIQSGGVHATAKPTRIGTILGSCVSACLYDPVTRVGGMNHFMLPQGTDDEMPTRYGIHAMEMLINALLKLGAHRENLVAKIFGASNVIANLGGVDGVAQRNANFVETFLADERIPVLARKLGGSLGLRVRFETATGRVFVRPIDPVQTVEVAERERESVIHPPAVASPIAAVTFF